MLNPININSTNIQQFGFKSTFDLLAKTLTFDISQLTVFNAGGAAAVLGVAFSVFDPSGLELAGINWETPSIVPASSSTFEVDIINGFAVFGAYKITGIIKDADGTLYTIELFKEICQPEGYDEEGFVNGKINVDVDCNAPSITINEYTKLIYKSNPPISVVKNGVLSYPPNTLADLDFSFTPFTLSGGGKVYTGRYTINNSTAATFDLQDNVYLIVTYQVTSLERLVNCTSALSTVFCCIEDIQKEYYNDPYSANGKAAKSKLDACSLNFMLAVAKEKAGKDATNDVKIIADILGCDCKCGSDNIEQSALGQNEIANLNIIGQNAAVVSSAVIGSTTQFTVNVKNINVTNTASDPAFSIARVETGSTITYAITFNYTAMAQSLLTAIQNDDDLTALLQNIVGSVAGGISLDGLNGGCVISLANCSYSLTEPNNTPKTIISIVIAGATYNAPSSLLLTNISGIATWLNGLGKGTFTTSIDNIVGTVTIASSNNPNAITLLNITTSTGALIRQFSRSCVQLVDFLNAIVVYICTLSSMEVVYGVTGDSICSYDGSGDLQTVSVDPSETLGVLIGQILAAQCQLFNKIANISVSCANMKALYTTATPQQIAAIIASDGVLATANGVCVNIKFSDLMPVLLALIPTIPALQTQFCNLVASCSAPICAAPTNVSGTLVTGITCVAITNLTGSVS